MESKHVLRMAEQKDKRTLRYHGPTTQALSCLSTETQTLNLLQLWLFWVSPILLQ